MSQIRQPVYGLLIILMIFLPFSFDGRELLPAYLKSNIARQSLHSVQLVSASCLSQIICIYNIYIYIFIIRNVAKSSF